MVTRRGGNRISMGGRFYLTDEKFQNKLSPARITELGILGYNRIIETKDFGFNVGGPLIKDKIWWWGSYGLQDIKTTVITGTNDNTLLTNMAAKINFQLLPQNRAEIFLHAGKKEKFGRSASTQNPLGMFQRGKYHFGSPIIKFQDEHMFGDNLFLSVKYGFTDAGFGNWPMMDQQLKEIRWYDVQQDLYTRSTTWFFSGRPNNDLVLNATYFNENLFGVSHEIKFGAEFTKRGNEYVTGTPAGMRVRWNYNTPTVDINNDGVRDIAKNYGVDIKLLEMRPVYQSTLGGVKSYAGWISDTITAGRLNIKLGVRYDYQQPFGGTNSAKHIFLKEDTSAPDLQYFYATQHRYTDEATLQAFNKIFPDVKAPSFQPDYHWANFSPRIGITWDVTGDGKTMAKLSGSVYHDYMGTIYWLWGYGGLNGWMNYWWWDKNTDGKFNTSELYWADFKKTARPLYNAFDSAGNFLGNWTRESGYMWGSFDYQNPTKTTASYYYVDPNWVPGRTWEALFTLERELTPDLGAAVDVTYRKYDRFSINTNNVEAWYYPDTKGRISQSDYMVAGTIPASLTDSTGKVVSTKEAAGRPWYVLKEGVEYTDYVIQANWPNDRNNTYFGADFVLTKRLSNRWMMNGSVSLGWQTQHYGKTGYNDPTNIWAQEGEAYAYNVGGGSGKLSVPTYSIWAVRAQGLYQLPLDFDISFTFSARQGWVIGESLTLSDYRLPNANEQSKEIRLKKFGDLSRLPVMWYVNARIQKVLKVSERGRIYLMADCFNVFNLDTLNRQYALNYGTFYLDTNTHSVSPRSGEPNEILNPRVFRFGVRFEF